MQVVINNLDAILMEPAARVFLASMSSTAVSLLGEIEACYQRRLAEVFAGALSDLRSCLHGLSVHHGCSLTPDKLVCLLCF
jgi:hypothetical protein